MESVRDLPLSDIVLSDVRVPIPSASLRKMTPNLMVEVARSVRSMVSSSPICSIISGARCTSEGTISQVSP